MMNEVRLNVKSSKIKFLEIREGLGLTQVEMALFLGMSQADISKLEHGKKVPQWLLRAIKLERALAVIDLSIKDLDF